MPPRQGEPKRGLSLIRNFCPQSPLHKHLGPETGKLLSVSASKANLCNENSRKAEEDTDLSSPAVKNSIFRKRPIRSGRLTPPRQGILDRGLGSIRNFGPSALMMRPSAQKCNRENHARLHHRRFSLRTSTGEEKDEKLFCIYVNSCTNA